jgi:ATP-binding cassette subfamily C protein
MIIEQVFRPLSGPHSLRPAAFLARMARLQPKAVAAATVVVSLLSVTEGFGLAMLLPLLGLIGVDTGSTQGTPARVIEQVMTAVGVPLSLGPILAVFFFLGIVQIVLTALRQFLIISSSEQVTFQLRQCLFDATSRARWSVLAAGRGSHLINAMVSESSRIGIIYGNSITMCGLIAGLAVYIALASWLSWQFTLVLVILGALSTLGLRRLYHASRRFGTYTSESTNRMQEILTEHVMAAKLIRSFDARERSRRMFSTAAEAVSRYLRRNQGNTVLVKASVEPFGLLVIVAMVYVSVRVIGQPAAELMLLLLIFYRLTPRLVQLQELLQRIHGVLPAYEAVSETLGRLVNAKEPTGTRQFVGLSSSIALRKIEARHEGRTILSNVDLNVAAGTTVALIGPSGGGKTTLLDILAGVTQPTRGDVLIDGLPLTDFNLSSYRQRIAVVPQDSFLFHDTIASNLRFSAPDATDEELWAALRAAHADVFVKAGAHGLDTVVGDQGLRMSGGQRQRLSLARALLRKPDILFLDEPSSALDMDTEEIILQTFRQLRGQLTIIVASHRASLAADADVAYVVTEAGIHVAKDGVSVSA